MLPAPVHSPTTILSSPATGACIVVVLKNLVGFVAVEPKKIACAAVDVLNLTE